MSVSEDTMTILLYLPTFMAWLTWKKILSSASSCVHSSNLSWVTDPFIRLKHIAYPSLWDPPRKTSLLHPSLNFFSSIQLMNSCWKEILFLETGHSWWWLFLYHLFSLSSFVHLPWYFSHYIHQKWYPCAHMFLRDAKMSSRDFQKILCMYKYSAS